MARFPPSPAPPSHPANAKIAPSAAAPHTPARRNPQPQRPAGFPVNVSTRHRRYGLRHGRSRCPRHRPHQNRTALAIALHHATSIGAESHQSVVSGKVGAAGMVHSRRPKPDLSPVDRITCILSGRGFLLQKAEQIVLAQPGNHADQRLVLHLGRLKGSSPPRRIRRKQGALLRLQHRQLRLRIARSSSSAGSASCPARCAAAHCPSAAESAVESAAESAVGSLLQIGDQLVQRP